MKVKPLYDTVVVDGTASGKYNTFLIWYDSTKEGTKFRVQREFEHLAVGDATLKDLEFVGKLYIIFYSTTSVYVTL